MEDLSKMRVFVGELINKYLNYEITIDDTIKQMPDLEKIRDASIDSVDHLLHHIELEQRRQLTTNKYLEELRSRLSKMVPFLLKGEEIDTALMYKPFYHKN